MIVQLTPLDARIPAWDFADLRERDCPICASAGCEDRYIRPDGLNTRLCHHCGTFFVSPSPSEEQLFEFYSHYDQAHRREPSATARELRFTYESRGPLTDLRVRELGSLISFPDSKVLDVGFGRAHFLYCLKRLGAKTHGLEHDPAAIELAEGLGLDGLRRGGIDEVPEDARFDLIVFNDFIEHPLKPMHVLKRASELLDPGGLISIWTPNGPLVSDSQPTALRVDLEHMQYLTPDSCLFIASELKLRVAHMETIGFPDLDGIDQPRSQTVSRGHTFKKVMKAMPGFLWLNKIKHRLFSRGAECTRAGTYHLFCVLQKPRTERID